ncbi:helix-turn-helix domain-containing protein [Streptomyces sp. NPDC052042]|uniref:helix-turn-helix domain-containing protein n=1 Tax=Streptomyces sp. NPDC052042 TaxID=3365683 RepID=UPI0037D33FF8
MSDHEQQQPAPSRGKVLDALVRAERKVFTRPAPKSAKAQVKFLLTRAKGSTKAVAERLGVSRRTVERYRARKLTLTTPQKRLRAALVGRRPNPSGSRRSEHRHVRGRPPRGG